MSILRTQKTDNGRGTPHTKTAISKRVYTSEKSKKPERSFS